MNQKEIREIRKRFRSEHQNVTKIFGCYVSDRGEVISRFEESLSLMTQDEQEKYLGVFKKVLGGTLEKNLRNLSFQTAQVADSDECRLLQGLRESQLQDESLLEEYFSKAVPAIHMETNYLILIAADSYDVPYKSKDGNLYDEGSDSVFRYIISAICPVKMTKPELTYVPEEQCFRNKGTDFILSAPEIGFMYPAFDDRAANLYGALYYTKSVKDSADAFVGSIFNLDPPMPAASQKENFYSVLESSLGEKCMLETCVAVQNGILNSIEANKELHAAEAPVITKSDIADILEERQLPAEQIAAFNEGFDEQFGVGAAIGSQNLVSAKKMELVAPDVVVRVNPERSDLVETRTIGESRYLMIRIEEGVSYNGVDLKFPE